MAIAIANSRVVLREMTKASRTLTFYLREFPLYRFASVPIPRFDPLYISIFSL